MKHFKRTIVAILCLCVMLGVTACGGTNNNDTGNGQNNDVTDGTDRRNDNGGVIDDVGDATGNVIDDIGNGVENITDDMTGNDNNSMNNNTDRNDNMNR